MKTNDSCLVCGNAALAPVETYRELSRVSSDCKQVPAGGAIGVCLACGAVHKPMTDRLRAEIGKIYAEYDVYYQGGGAEQVVFDPDGGPPVRRSDLLVRKLAAEGILAPKGDVIDVGCGNGVFLRSFAKSMPAWRLHGLDLDERYLEDLKSIPGFDGLATVDVKQLKGSYQLISLIHALEHFFDPYECLAALTENLAPNGYLFIQVPNAEENPFDYLIADHVSHFTPATLVRLLQRAGLQALVMHRDWVKKELSVLACPSRSEAHPGGAVQEEARPADPGALVEARIGWLCDVQKQALELSETAPFGLFGTSIAGTWLTGVLGDRLGFFVDEDPSRQGQSLFGRPILAPESVPAGAQVFVSLSPLVAGPAVERLCHLPVVFHLPPDLPA